MLSPGKKRQRFVGKLLLSSALVAVSLVYGWWQRHNATRPNIAIAPVPVPPAANRFAPARGHVGTTARAEPTAPATSATPDVGVAASPHGISGQTTGAPATPRTATIAVASPQTKAPAAASAAPSEQNVSLPTPPAADSLTALASLPMYQPPPLQSPLPLVTGMPSPGAAVPIPPGTHLQDGDYLSDTQQYEWGDLTVKISVHGGKITGVQVVQYPDHRSESLELSQMASPILDSEVIRTQQSRVDVVSSATDTSYAYRDAIASAIIKATR
ncbi:MAG TPA: FMN-binding protein [Rhizomicrobium sp.]|nr:FMN-binding protein [Rhizomicrobium sp.]